jgi:glycosyltransferase involved in cell wall biosynthesis
MTGPTANSAPDRRQLAASGRVALVVGSLEIGGAERVTVHLACGLSQAGVPTDLVLGNARGEFLTQVPPAVRVCPLGAETLRRAVLPLARYLRSARPAAVVAQMSFAGVAALVARRVARIDVPVVVVQQNQLSQHVGDGHISRPRLALIKWLYPRAEALVGVSDGVSRDLEQRLGLPPWSVHTIYNPIVDGRLHQMAAEPAEHPWLAGDGPPVLLAVGRLARQKDYATLLAAFAMLRKRRTVRLLILGEGSERPHLQQLCNTLGIAGDVALPGTTTNPYACMARAAALVLSSRFEGLPTVLVEALACGCPVVSTDCPSGPSEILAQARFGRLVPVANPTALAAGLADVLEHPPPREPLRARADDFSHERAVAKYLSLLHDVARRERAPRRVA